MAKYSDYIKIFTDAFLISESEATTLKYQGIEGWDSVGHMSLMAALEDIFEVELDIDDIIAFSSFEASTSKAATVTSKKSEANVGINASSATD